MSRAKASFALIVNHVMKGDERMPIRITVIATLAVNQQGAREFVGVQRWGFGEQELETQAQLGLLSW